MKFIIGMLFLASVPFVVQAQEPLPERQAPQAPAPVQNPELRDFLLNLKKVNQSIRAELIAKGYGRLDSLDLARQAAVDEANQEHLKEIVENFGWPDRFMVGMDGVEAAFLIAQNSDHAFQRQILPAIRAAYQRGDLVSGDYALYVDGILVEESNVQRFGTQAYVEEGKLKLYPIEDRANVDERRAELGLEPLAEYVRKLATRYGLPAEEYP
jgi:hypothetical protein